MIKKQYLGDGLYAAFDGYQFVLTAENGIEAYATVYLEPEVLDSFYRYVDHVKTELKKARETTKELNKVFQP